MLKLKKHRGFSFYDIIISLIILVLASVFITKIFVGAVELQNKNKIISACTFEAIETIENFKTLKNTSVEDRNKYLQTFKYQQNSDDNMYTKDIDILGKTYKEVVTIAVVEENEVQKIRTAKVSNSDVDNEIDYETIINNLLEVNVEFLDNKDRVVYNIGTYFIKNYKELN